MRSLRLVVIIIAMLSVGFVLLRWACPTSGIALTRERFGIQGLKNRANVPEPNDFDQRVTLQTLLERGVDRDRWSTKKAGRISGTVVAVTPGPLEAANCFCRRDVHIMLAAREGAPPAEQVVLEVTPRFAAHAENEGSVKDWSYDSLSRLLPGKYVQFEGWMFFDSAHAGEAENTAPGRANNWRGTAWEIHPVTKIVIREQ